MYFPQVFGINAIFGYGFLWNVNGLLWAFSASMLYSVPVIWMLALVPHFARRECLAAISYRNRPNLIRSFIRPIWHRMYQISLYRFPRCDSIWLLKILYSLIVDVSRGSKPLSKDLPLLLVWVNPNLLWFDFCTYAFHESYKRRHGWLIRCRIQVLLRGYTRFDWEPRLLHRS